jgi:predicted ATPase/uncharacterized protein HemY
MLADEGILGETAGMFQLVGDADATLERVPASLQGLILARVDTLDDRAKRVLQEASVLCPVFRSELLAAVSQLPANQVAQTIAQLAKRQFLVPVAGRGGGYEFRHALIRDTVYNSLLTRYRRSLHAQTADAIAESDDYLPHERAELMAYHLAKGPRPTTAIPHLLAAADHAAQRFANETVLQHYQQILDLKQGQVGTEFDGAVALQVQVGIGRAQKLLGNYAAADAALQPLAAAFAAWRETKEPDSLMTTLLDGLRELADVRQREGEYEAAAAHIEAGIAVLEETGPSEQPDLHRALRERLAFVRFRQGQLDEALSIALRAVADLSLEDVADPVTVASLFNTLGGISWQLGNVEEALDYVQKSLRIYQGISYAWGMAQAYSNLGVLNAQLGNWSQTIENWEKAVALRAGTADVLGQATALSNLGQLRMMMGQTDSSHENLEESLAIFHELGDDWGTAQVLINLAQLELAQDRPQRAHEYVLRALALADSVQAQSVQVVGRGIRAMVESATGDLATALASATQALHMAKEAGLLEAEGEVLRMMGMLLTKQGSFVEAETMLKQSTELSQQMRNPYNQGLALLELGQLYRAMADTQQQTQTEWLRRSLQSLRECEAILANLGAARDLQKAHDAIGEVEQRIVSDRSRLQPAAGSTSMAGQSTSGERALATVLWLVMTVGDANEELLFETMAFLLPACATIAQEYGGFVRQRSDGLTIIFGAPEAYEDGPDRAVTVAGQIARYVQQEREETGISLSFQMGVSQGQVLAGYALRGRHSEFVVQGEPMDAARAAAESSPHDTILVTDEIRRTTSRLAQFAPVDPDAATNYWALIRLRDTPGPARGLPGIRTRFIGRSDFLQAMNRVYENLQVGLGGIVWIEGEAGIGKSRLMLEFRNQATLSDVLVWNGGCAAQRAKAAFSLFSDLVAQVFDLKSAETAEEVRASIGATLEGWPMDIRSTRPYLELLAGISPGGVEGQRIASLEPDQLRQQIFVAFRRLLKSLAREQPIVLILDDLHWIDPMSAELLLFIATVVASDRVLLVCAQRREGSDSPNDRLLRLQSLLPGQTARLFLDRLSVDDSEALIRELLPDVTLPDELCEGVINRSEGNPYFIEEFVRMLLEQDYLEPGDAGWQINPAVTWTEIPVPTSLEALIRSRVDGLPSELKETLQCASVIGRRFRGDLVQELLEEPNVSLLLERLASRVILREADDAGRWEFTHHLIESVVYGSMLRAQRQALHLRVGEVLEQQWNGQETDHAEELAYHFLNGGSELHALDYLVLAGEKAITRNANEEALAHLQRAAEILSRNPDTDERLQWRVTVGLGDVYRFIGKYPESTSVLRSGLPLAQTGRLFRPQRAGLYRRLGETAQKQGEIEKARRYFTMTQIMLGEPEEPQYQLEAARTLAGMAWGHFYLGQFEEAREACEESLAFAARADGLAELASAENLLGGIYYHLGEWHTALHHTTRAMVLREQMGYSWGVAATLSNLGILSFSSGQWNKALSFFRRSLTMRQEMGDVEGVSITNNNLGMVYREQGELGKAETHFRASLEMARVFRIAYHVANAHSGLASVQLLQRDLTGAGEMLADGMAQAEAIGAQDIMAEMKRLQAEISLARDDYGQAHEMALAAGALAARIGNRSYESAAWRVASEIARRQSDLGKARGFLAKSQEALSEVKDDLETARVAMQAGRIARDDGDLASARAHLREAKQILTRLGANLYLQELELLTM